MNGKELVILIALVAGFALMGSAAGAAGLFTFAGIGLTVWIVWRGRKL
jgi:hypothetical protein